MITLSWFKKKDPDKKEPKVSSFQKMKETLTKSFDEVKEEFTEKSVESRVKQTSRPEEFVYSIYGWFWGLLLWITIVFIGIIFALSNPKLWLVAILLIIALPFGVYYCLTHMIPSIKIFGFTIFDRNKLSMKQQMNFSTAVARMITREFIRENPLAAYSVLLFFGLLLIAFLSAYW